MALKKSIKLDQINKNILIQLQQNARMSNLELADKVGLSPSACLQRTKALEEAGYILQYVGAVDLDRICEYVMAYLEITLMSQRLDQVDRFEQAITKIPEMVDCLRVSGRFDYISFVVCSSISAFNEMCDALLSSDIGVASVRSSIVLDKPKWFAGYPLSMLRWKE
jgi:Lrp/AsnC family leucine-responsive transcriptional regulator